MTLVRRIVRPSALALGAGFGFYVVHPLSMVPFASYPGSFPERFLDAMAQSIAWKMLPMTVAFVLLCAAVAVLCASAFEGREEEPEESRSKDEEPEQLCVFCKSMPQTGGDGDEHWLPFEQVLYQSRHVEFTHRVCPRCSTHLGVPGQEGDERESRSD